MRKVIISAGHDIKFKGAYSAVADVHEHDYASRFIHDLRYMMIERDLILPDTEIILMDMNDPSKLIGSNSSLFMKAESVEHMDDFEIFIEIHLNSFHDVNVNGTEILYKNENSLGFCNLFSFNFELYFPDFKYRGIVKRNNLYLLNVIEKPAVLIELFFLSNYEEYKLFSYDDNYNKLLMVVAKTINDWLNGMEVKG